jgi:hypothetical protein
MERLDTLVKGRERKGKKCREDEEKYVISGIGIDWLDTLLKDR